MEGVARNPVDVPPLNVAGVHGVVELRLSQSKRRIFTVFLQILQILFLGFLVIFMWQKFAATPAKLHKEHTSSPHASFASSVRPAPPPHVWKRSAL